MEIKKHWKVIVLIIIILGFLFYYEILPRYNQKIAGIGYGLAINDLSNGKAFPLNITNGNETQMVFLSVCSQEFQQNYNRICPG